ncbi:hypothetical protein [Cetobacterium sp.]|uniref:hypothetical protein n=1 Tax=Cetobacterium sp. TaxID=2071632 RepID=UPI003EE55C8B
MKDIIISGVNICLAIFTLTLNWKISTRDYQKKEEEKKEKKTNLRLNIIKMMEYNSSILVKCFKHPMRSGEVLNDLIILKGYTERLIILDEEFKNSVNVLYTYFLKIEKKEVDSFCLFEKKYTKFLKFIPEEEAYYFLEKKYRDVLLKLKSEKTNTLLLRMREKE